MVPWFPPPTPSPTAVADRVVGCAVGSSSQPGLAQGFGDDSTAMMDDVATPCEAMPEPTFVSIMFLWGAALLINSGCIGLVCIVGYRICRARFSRDHDGDGGAIVVSPLWPSTTDVEWAGRRVSLTAGGRAWWETVPADEHEVQDQQAAVREGREEEVDEAEEAEVVGEIGESDGVLSANASHEGGAGAGARRTRSEEANTNSDAGVELQPIRRSAPTVALVQNDEGERSACVVRGGAGDRVGT